MCTNCLDIASPAKFYRPYSRKSLQVPCGHCPSCQEQAQDDWYIRIWSEIKKYNDAGGKVVIFHPTYNNENLPIFTDIDEETGEVFRIPGFSKAHTLKFRKSMAKWFERRGHTIKTDPDGLGLKFFWPSEYGLSPFGTHRPHYHPLIFIPKDYFKEFKSKQQIKNLIKSYWTYGFVNWSKEEDGGLFVTSQYAGKYVSKYCTKDLAYFQQPVVEAYLYDSDGKVIQDRYEKLKSFLPRHWQSKSFGLGLTQYCENDKVFIEGLPFGFLPDFRDGKKRSYRVPRYIERKLLYNRELIQAPAVDKNGKSLGFVQTKEIEVLNERGKYVKSLLDSFDDKIARMALHNTDYTQVEYIKKSIANDFQEFNRKYGYGYTSFEDVTGAFLDFKKQVSYVELACWQLVLSGTGFSSRLERDGVARMSEHELVEFCRQLYRKRIEDPDRYSCLFFKEGFSKKNFGNNLYTLEKVPKFAVMDAYSKLSYSVEDFYRNKVNDQYIRDRIRKKQLKLKLA